MGGEKKEDAQSLDILIVGSKGVGKSSLLLYFKNNTRPNTPPPTSKFIHETESVYLSKDTIKLNIWDTSGMEESNKLLSMYYEGVHGVVLMYDVTDRDSLDKLKSWVSAQNKLSMKKNLQKILVANKSDKNMVREIKEEEGEKYAKKIDAAYIETNAMNGKNVRGTFLLLVEKILPHTDFELVDAPTHNLTLNNTSYGQNSAESPIGDEATITLDILLVGECGVGKTSLMQRLTSRDTEIMSYQPTIAVDYRSTVLNIRDKKVKLRIYDPSGKENFRCLLPNYYRSAHGIMLVYDVSRRKSFDELEYWISQVWEHSKRKNAVKMVIGNKIDLGREISNDEGYNFAKAKEARFFETSAKNDHNVELAFEHLAQQIMLSPDVNHDNRFRLYGSVSQSHIPGTNPGFQIMGPNKCC